MTTEMIIIAAFLLDCAAGDPRWFPHPVRGIGKLANLMESFTRKMIPSYLRLAGIITALFVIGTCGILSWGSIFLLSKVHTAAGIVAGILFVYFSIAPRDLFNHSIAVYNALKSDDVNKARIKVSMIVGRDVDHLDDKEITRATVETVAESLVDGVTAPLFYAFIFGPSGAFVYRSINTLDSMFGHKNEKYLYFGWASARIDDIANYIPARITAPLIAIAALCLKMNFLSSFKIFIRDGRKHHSPNSGLSEAAFAGAMEVQLGGMNYYDGIPDSKPTIGDAVKSLIMQDIVKSNLLMYTTTVLIIATGFLVRFFIF